MDTLGIFQEILIRIFALTWGFLALLISGVYFLCEWKPQKCENFRKWLEKKFPALGSKRKK